MQWLVRIKAYLVWVTLGFLGLLVLLLVDTFLSEGDMALVFMSTAITISTLVTLTLSYEALYTSSHHALDARKGQLHLLRNYFRSAELLTQTLKSNLESGTDEGVSTVHLREFVQTLAGVYDALLAKEQMGMIAEELVRITENRVRVRELSDLLDAERPDPQSLMGVVERISRTNRIAEDKLQRLLDAKSAESFEKIARASKA